MVISDYINDVADPKTRRAIQAVFENLGGLITDDSIKQKSFDRDYTLEEFESSPVVSLKGTGGAPDYAMTKALAIELRTWAGTLATKLNADAGVTDVDYDAIITASDPTGTAGDENLLVFDDNIFEYHILGTQTITAPVISATGLNIGMDQTDNDGVEITQGILSNSRSVFVVGTSKSFSLKVGITIPDVSGTDDCAIGFRKAEAYQAAIDNYDEMVAINVISGAIKTETILNGAATTTTDTTDTFTDGASKTLEVNVSATGIVTYKVDGVAPTTTAAFTFDDGEVVVPFIYFLHAGDIAGAVTLTKYECGPNE